MKNHNHCSRLQFIAAIFILSIVTSANAALVDRGGGMIYDTDLNITWLADANYAKTSGYSADGRMSWSSAVTWASNLVYGGYSDWRLPTTKLVDSTCADGGINSLGYNCTGSEMGHLFYSELGGTAGNSILSSGDPDLALFHNIQGSYYWSSNYIYMPSSAYFFSFGSGDQSANYTSCCTWYAWAVRTGDVTSVPIPTAFWLFGSGLIGLFGFVRKITLGSARPCSLLLHERWGENMIFAASLKLPRRRTAATARSL